MNNHISLLSRRDALSMASCGFGYLALRGLLADDCHASGFSNPLSEKSPHFKPKAKRVIFLYMDGGPSQVDTFDPKPALSKYNGQDPHRVFKVEPRQFNNIGKSTKELEKSHVYLMLSDRYNMQTKILKVNAADRDLRLSDD